MHIIRDSLLIGARKAKGISVIIDVFRASTTAGFILNKNAMEIIPVERVHEAFVYRSQYPEALLVGERNGLKLDGFDYGNSPTEINEVDFKGKRVVFTTSAGTKGIMNAEYSDEVLFGSFVNAEAVVRYIKKKCPNHVTLVAMGIGGEKKCDEDELCAEYLKQLLENQTFNFRFFSRLVVGKSLYDLQ